MSQRVKARGDIVNAVRDYLVTLGFERDSETIENTPARFVAAFEEMIGGYHETPAGILAKVFDTNSDEMIVVRGIPFWSLCEHHMLPFNGTATVGYVPRGGKVVGLSKIPRLVRCLARRLQMQERLTMEIAEWMLECLNPLGVGVLIRGEHLCMRIRGVESEGSMVTSCLRGVIAENPAARAEFMKLAE